MGHGEGEAADVVGRDRGADMGVRLHQSQRAPFVGGVGLLLLGENGDGPAVLAGDDRLGVPVGAAHQADRHRRAALARPLDQRRDVGFGLAEVGLKGDAAIGPGAELRLHEDLAEGVERYLLCVEVLHVEGDGRPHLPRPAQHRPQALLHPRRARLGGNGVQLGVEGGELEGEVEAGR